MISQTDPRLSLIRRGDENAFEDFTREHYRTVHTFASAFIVPKIHTTEDREMIAEDLTDRTLQAFWKERRHIQNKTPINSYLINMVFRIGIEIIRRYQAQLN